MIFIAAALTLAVFLPACGTQSDDERRCSAITKIAGDAQKMRYAKEWIASHLSDRRFREILRKGRSFEHNDYRIQEFGSLDWEFLGIPADFASLDFNLVLNEAGQWDIDRIDSASLTVGRVSIIVRLGPGKGLGLDWPPEELAKIRPVGEDVFVYCGSAD